MSVRLIPDDGDPVNLNDPTAGIVNVSVQVGAPAPRESVFDRPGDDGTDDHTAHVGARAVTVALSFHERPHTRQALLDRVSALMHPANRLWLEHTAAPGHPPRRLRVRPDDAPIDWSKPSTLAFAWAFRTVGRPFWLGEPRTLDLAPVGPLPGFGFDLEWDLVFPDAPVSITQAVHTGTIAAAWTWTLRGPVRSPALRNETTGELVWLRGLDLLAGQTAVVDSVTRSVTVDGTTAYAVIDQAATSWWTLPAHTTTPVAMTVPAAAGVPAGTLAWSDTFYA